MVRTHNITLLLLFAFTHTMRSDQALQAILQDFKTHNQHVEKIQKNPKQVYSATHQAVQRPIAAAASARTRPWDAQAIKTQTNSYLSLPSLKQQVDIWFGNADQTLYRTQSPINEFKGNQGTKEKYLTIFNNCIAKEQELASDYFVFYHAHPTLIRIVQDLDKELYQLVTGKQLPHDFIFLRAYNQEAFQLPPLDVWLDEKVRKYGNQFNNNLPDVQPYLLSANCSFFARMSRPASNTFFYFLTSRAGKPPAFGTLVNFVISPFTLDDAKKEQYITELYQLDDLLMGSTGDLLQIFLPKSVVDKYTYLSASRGVIWNSVIDAITQGFNTARQRYDKLSPVLEIYRTNPQQIKNEIDKIEARIFLHGTLTRDPATGMKLFRHSTSPEALQPVYMQKIKTIAQRIYNDWKMSDNKPPLYASKKSPQRPIQVKAAV